MVLAEHYIDDMSSRIPCFIAMPDFKQYFSCRKSQTYNFIGICHKFSRFVRVFFFFFFLGGGGGGEGRCEGKPIIVFTA